MPQQFDNCRAKGGKVRTISGPNKQYNLAEGEYIRVCIIKENGKSQMYLGEKKRKHSVIRILSK